MKFKSFIALLLISAGLIYAGAGIIKFYAKSSGGNIVLSWETSSESNLRYFVVERKTYNGSYMELGTVNPRDDKSYEFTDHSAFKTSDQLYIYRIKIVDNDGSLSYSIEQSVAHNVSSVKRTWGSIKALFR